jgi:hypothetical protein
MRVIEEWAQWAQWAHQKNIGKGKNRQKHSRRILYTVYTGKHIYMIYTYHVFHNTTPYVMNFD